MCVMVASNQSGRAVIDRDLLMLGGALRMLLVAAAAWKVARRRVAKGKARWPKVLANCAMPC